MQNQSGSLGGFNVCSPRDTGAMGSLEVLKYVQVLSNNRGAQKSVSDRERAGAYNLWLRQRHHILNKFYTAKSKTQIQLSGV